MSNPIAWLKERLTRRHRELLYDIPKLDDKAKELDERLHPVASRTHVLEFEAYGQVRPKDKPPEDMT